MVVEGKNQHMVFPRIPSNPNHVLMPETSTVPQSTNPALVASTFQWISQKSIHETMQCSTNSEVVAQPF